MLKTDKVRVYELARELKQDVWQIIKDLQRQGADIDVPSNSVSKEFAEKIRNKYFPKAEVAPKRTIKVLKSIKNIKKSAVETVQPNHKESVKNDKKYKNCEFCAAIISINKYEKHVTQKCSKRFDGSKEKTSSKLNENSPQLSIEILSWTLLPKGQWLFNVLKKHFTQLNSTPKWKNKTFDQTRLLTIEKALKPSRCFIGNDEFEGYIVYCFNWTDRIILECPIYGNATYVIKSGKYTWQEIAKASKWEARTEHYDQVKVINHSGTWFERLEQNLRYGF